MLRMSLLRLLVVPSVLIVAASPAAHAAEEVVRCRGLQATLVGTSGPDTLYGTPDDDVIVSLGGDDIVFAWDGNDVVCGGAGGDEIHGGAGADSLFGGPDGDVLRGGTEDDALGGGRGHDRLVGGSGDDVLRGSRGGDELTGGRGFDVTDGGRRNDACRRSEWAISCERPIPEDPGDAVNCTDFATWREAQIWFDRYATAYGDIAHLDNDGDGVACETRPRVPQPSGRA
ncbi:MAG TPA: excalibur calcium-binding domain-containing protein [Acidimicrobiia bacterium]